MSCHDNLVATQLGVTISSLSVNTWVYINSTLNLYSYRNMQASDDKTCVLGKMVIRVIHKSRFIKTLAQITFSVPQQFNMPFISVTSMTVVHIP